MEEREDIFFTTCKQEREISYVFMFHRIKERDDFILYINGRNGEVLFFLQLSLKTGRSAIPFTYMNERK
jgi:hypothetical protein